MSVLTMEETPAPGTSLEARRRRLLFRATHRGTKETDLLVGGFVAARLNEFSLPELDAIEAILELPDPELADWLTGRAPLPDDKMIRRMAEAAHTPGARAKE